jgi:tetratricopeptide (TPR) repeat protein
MQVKVRPGRNDPCPCGSGTKFKKCCGSALKIQGKEALQALRSTSRLVSDDANVLNNMGNSYLGLGQLDRAVASYRHALQISPNFAGAHSNLGNALQSLGQLDEAVSCYRRALQLQPDFAEAHNNLGNALRDLGRFDEALACYRSALQIRQDYAEAHNNMGNALRDLGQLDRAVSSYRRALVLKPAYPEAHNNLGNALRDLGQFDDAVASFRRGLALRSDYAELHGNLGNALFDLGQLDDAVTSYRRALELKSDYAEAYNNMGSALRDLGRLDDAIASYRHALAIRSDYAEAYANLGNALRDLGQMDAAAASYRQALALTPNFAEAHDNLSVVLRLQGRIAEAEAGCRRALAIEPNRATTLVLLADLQADKGQFAEAEALFRRAISIASELPEAWAGIARWRKMTSSDTAWLAEVQRIAGQRLRPRKEAYLRYALGKYFDDVKDFEQAFHHFQRANELAKLHAAKHDRHRLTQAVDRMISAYDHHWRGRTSANATASSCPVFVVGMPRSGTTLTEQILASHPSVFGAGELPFWGAASAMHESCAPLGQLADDYLQLLATLAPEALRIVDKMPGNFMFLGLIHSALPNARIIHMQRDPIDTCLSIYIQHFQNAHSYTNDLEDLAHYYMQYLRIMKHWRSVLPRDALLDVPYEELVDDPQTWSRRMLEFIGLPWDARCLEFHRTERTVITASKWQVRQKISQASIGRWRNYERYIGPLTILRDCV